MVLNVSQELKCILRLSFGFMTMFAAETTRENMLKTVISSMEDDRPDFHVEGYTLGATMYTTYTIVVLLGAPYINGAIGSRLTMFVCSVGVLIGIATLLCEITWVVYAGGVLIGAVSGILWPAECHYMIKNSSPETTGRNVSIFWCIYSLSSLIGNCFVYYSIRNKRYINRATRRTAVYCLLALMVLAVVQFACLPKSISKQKAKNYSPFKTLHNMWSLLKSKKILWLTPSFCYIGLQGAFWSGIYSPSLGFTLAFGDSAKELVALSGICMSIGAVAGALFSILFSRVLSRQRYARRLMVAAGSLAGLCSYLVTFLNLTDEAAWGNTGKKAFISPPSIPLALLGSFLLCAGDSFLNIQVNSYIGDHYRDFSTEACAFYKFTKNVFVSLSFFWCSHLGLHTQLIILVLMSITGMVSFFVGDRHHIPRPLEGNTTSTVDTTN